MSIFKSEHRQKRSLWSIIAGHLLRQRCASFITMYRGNSLKCELLRGHSSRHKDGTVTWVYGDNWMEMEEKL